MKKEQLERLRAGVEVWNAWREGEGEGVRIDLSNAYLRRADLSGANLRNATLSGATLRGATLSGADLSFAILLGATLRDANLSGADLSGADLRNTDLSHARLTEAIFRRAIFGGADFGGAKFGAGTLGYLDLSEALSLAEVNHVFPSSIDTDTLEKTAQGLMNVPPERRGEVEIFLRGAGVEDHLIEYYRSRIGMPIEFHSAFISYSHADKAFARSLFNDLQAQGIRCWLDEKDARLGDRILHVVNQAIRSTDRVLLCCSLESLTSPWVDRELAIAFEKEQVGEEGILIPLDLDGYLFDGWDGRGRGPILRERIAGNFVGWKQDADLYARELERVVEAMRPRGDRDGE